MSNTPWHLFDVYGIEIEYMIVDRDSLNIRPWADRLLRDTDGQIANEVAHGPLTWCNELASHVIELKCSQPATDLTPLADAFRHNVAQLNQQLAAHTAMVLPTGMHPWMDPLQELVLWPQQNNEIYRAYDRIFSCKGHGWANLQSVQINLPFADDEEFGRLHAAMRFALPLLCGLAASTPFAEGRFTGYHDYRMETYRHNARRIPQVTGAVIPEAVFTIDGYHQQILQPMYRAIAPLDHAQVLQEDWLNSRGALPRFERQSIEIRTLDSQECVRADLAIITAVCALLQALVEARWCSYSAQQQVPDDVLINLFQSSIRHAEHSQVATGPWHQLLGLPLRDMSLGQLWGHVLERLSGEGLLPRDVETTLQHIISHGTLASRLLRRADQTPALPRLRAVYEELARCLQSDQQLD